MRYFQNLARKSPRVIKEHDDGQLCLDPSVATQRKHISFQQLIWKHHTL